MFEREGVNLFLVFRNVKILGVGGWFWDLVGFVGLVRKILDWL